MPSSNSWKYRLFILPKLEINVNDLLGQCETWTEYAAMDISGKRLRLSVNHEGSYRVDHGGVTLYYGISPKIATNTFNGV